MESDLSGHEVLVGVAGGIAAYKVCEVVSRLVQRGAGVTVAMTRAARRFVGPVTFQALSGRKVLTSLWDAEAKDIQHIDASLSASAMLIAPATADIIARIATGMADDIVTSLVLTCRAPILVAPAMNSRMWENVAVQRNVNMLRERGFLIVGPGSGWMACREVGEGRMAESSEIVERLGSILRPGPRSA